MTGRGGGDAPVAGMTANGPSMSHEGAGRSGACGEGRLTQPLVRPRTAPRHKRRIAVVSGGKRTVRGTAPLLDSTAPW